MSCFLHGNKLLTASTGVVRFCTSLHKHYAASKLFYLKKEYIVVIGKKVQQGRARRRPALFGLSAP